MTPRMWIAVAAVAGITLVVAAVAMSGRYAMVVGGGGTIYTMDRFTGAVWHCFGSECRPLPTVAPQR